MNLNTKWLKVLIIVFVVASAGSGYFYLHRGEISTDDATIDGSAVVLSPKVSGYVKTLNIKDNQQVKAGDVLLEIDPTDYIIRRDKAKAALTAAQAAAAAAHNNLETTSVSAPSNVDSTAAQVAAAQATWEKSFADRKRMESLYRVRAIAQQQLDQAIAIEKSDRANLDKLQADHRAANTAPSVIAAAQSTSDQLQAQIKQAEADLAQAEADLANTKIIAPMDGRITKRSVEPGNYVQTGQQMASLVGRDLWITANFKENQLEHIQIGQPVDIRIDAYPDIKLHGKVDSLQAGTGAYFSLFPAENATGNFVKTVQRIPVKIVFDNPPNDTIAIGPGMSVIPTVYTDTAGEKI